MNTDKLRKLYLDYFRGRDHRYFASDSLVPQDDPTLLFTGAGMNQFKPYFLGLKKDVRRATSCQKCIRTADLDRVGKTAYHHTFFEMLGNFSFGDYFKEEAIGYAWEFVTKELRMNRDELWVSVYQDDDEAFQIWKRKIGIPEGRIVRFGASDNFWPANAPAEGPNGPCGPCSEIYVGREPGKGVEIWNLVFTEYDRQDSGLLKPLPQKNIDTGMGLERLASVMQGVASNFETDLFVRMLAEMDFVLGHRLIRQAPLPVRNAILDHLRAMVFAMADGVIPSNEGRGYVVRKLIRRSSLLLRKAGLEEPALYRLTGTVVGTMQGAYPELALREAAIRSLLKKEEESVWSILQTRAPEAEIKFKTIALTTPRGQEAFASERVTRLAFEFYDTYGVPKEILQDLIEDNGLVLDAALFESCMETQRKRSRAASKLEDSIFGGKGSEDNLSHLPETEFIGYDSLKGEARILGIFLEGKAADRLERGQKGHLLVDRTPFYAEQGGQVGDSGAAHAGASELRVLDAQWKGHVVFHEAEVLAGSVCVGDAVVLTVDETRRKRILSNHTATHLLHSALRQVLGPQVQQRGSLVAPDRLRFDFSHSQSLTRGQIQKVEGLVNAEIARKTELQVLEQDLQTAMAQGAMAFFGDKYDQRVRVVSIGSFSKELCGGTHVRHTGQIGSLRIVSEGSVQSGVRRIEGVTGEEASRLTQRDREEWQSLLSEFNADDGSVLKAWTGFGQTLTRLNQRLKNARSRSSRAAIVASFRQAPDQNGLKTWVTSVRGADKDFLREAADWLRAEKLTFAACLFGPQEGRLPFVVVVSSDLIAKGWDAVVLAREIAGTSGNAGGKPELALGGLKDTAGDATDLCPQAQAVFDRKARAGA